MSSEEIKNEELDHELEQEDVCKTETPDEMEETPEQDNEKDTASEKKSFFKKKMYELTKLF